MFFPHGSDVETCFPGERRGRTERFAKNRALILDYVSRNSMILSGLLKVTVPEQDTVIQRSSPRDDNGAQSLHKLVLNITLDFLT